MLILPLIFVHPLSAYGSEQSAASAADPPTARTVETVVAEMRRIERAVSVIGTLRSWEEATLSVRVGGFLRRLDVDIGDEVREGRLVAVIDPEEYEMMLRQAEAAVVQARARLGLPLDGEDIPSERDVEVVSRVRQARAVLDEASRTLGRISELYDAGLISASELDQAQASHEVALHRHDEVREETRDLIATLLQRVAQRDLARKRLEYTSLYAPFDGVVQRRLAVAGEYLPEATPVLSLVRVNPLRLRLEVPERFVSLVRAGQTVRFRVENDPSEYRGELARLSPMLREVDRVLVVEADVINPGSLRPGLFTRGEVIVDGEEARVVVPADAIRSFVGIDRVFLVRDGEAVETRVETGRSSGGWVEILEGVREGDLVIMNPGGIRSGERVVSIAGGGDRP